MNEGTAIRCINCTHRARKLEYDEKLNKRIFKGEYFLMHDVLGSITPAGYLLIKRAHGDEFTQIKAELFTIYCICGYFVEINMNSGHDPMNQSYAEN